VLYGPLTGDRHWQNGEPNLTDNAHFFSSEEEKNGRSFKLLQQVNK
jgi:hypothetical protein